MICHGQSITYILDGISRVDEHDVWAKRIKYMLPRNVVELGTGQGATAAKIALALMPGAYFTTINYSYPDNCKFGEQLIPYLSPYVRMIMADTLDINTTYMTPPNIDLLYIDSTHYAWHSSLELKTWQDVLEDGAIVIVDDLNHNDMIHFWYTLPYEKALDGDQGVFRFRKALRYDSIFPRGMTDKERAEQCSS